MPRREMQFQRHNRVETLVAQRTFEADVTLKQMILQVFAFGEGIVAFAAQKLREMLFNMQIILVAVIEHHISALLTDELLLRVVERGVHFELLAAASSRVILLQMAFQMKPKHLEIGQRGVALVAQEDL